MCALPACQTEYEFSRPVEQSNSRTIEQSNRRVSLAVGTFCDPDLSCDRSMNQERAVGLPRAVPNRTLLLVLDGRGCRGVFKSVYSSRHPSGLGPTSKVKVACLSAWQRKSNHRKFPKLLQVGDLQYFKLRLRPASRRVRRHSAAHFLIFFLVDRPTGPATWPAPVPASRTPSGSS